MCGICGIFDPSGRASPGPQRDTLAALTANLEHRGPDGSGVYLDGPVGLGAARLAIIDLSARANQPLVIDDGAFALAFNGEIYNYVELRRELSERGVRFQTASDTEVLLRLYAEEGVACLQRLRGMFAFGLWDRARRRLFLARDRAGEKPLVYSTDGGLFSFASEIGALLTLPHVSRELDREGLHFGLHYVTVPAPHSAYASIRKLRPAEYLLVSAAGIEAERYWVPRYRTDNAIKAMPEAVEAFNHCLDETVAITCRSDVPIGVTLSGGIDSSVVAASMARALPEIETFCVSHAPGDAVFAAARLVAEHLGTRHHEILFARDELGNAEDVVTAFSEPVCSFVPMHALALARVMGSRVKVALTGSGGNELYGGYAEHQWLLHQQRNAPLWRKLAERDLGEEGPVGLPPHRRHELREGVRLSQLPANRVYADRRYRQITRFCDQVYTPSMKAATREIDVAAPVAAAFDAFGAPDLFNGFMAQQYSLVSTHSVCEIPDILGMRCSLEYRSPFLDREMFDLAVRIPWELKTQPGEEGTGCRLVVREAMKGRLPEATYRGVKSGFGASIPFDELLFDDWRDFVEGAFSSPAMREADIFAPDALLGAYRRARVDRRIPREILWGIATMGVLLEQR